MKKLILFLAVALSAISAGAQNFIYEMTGEVTVWHDGKWMNAYKTMQLSPEDSIRTAEFSSVVVLDRTSDRIYSFQSVCPAALADLAASQKPKTRRLLAEVAQGLLNALFTRNDRSMSAYDGVSGVSYRGEDEDRMVAAALAAGQKSSASVSFRILDCRTMKPTDVVQVGEEAVVEVINHADTPLYFNIIDTDSSGNSAPVLPFDELQTMLHLYIPPMSVVGLEEYPIGFYEPCGVDRLTLVASVFPFDLQNVIDMIPSVRPSASPDVHLFRSSLRIVPSDR